MDDLIQGRIAIRIGGVEVSHIKFAIEIIANPDKAVHGSPLPENVLAAAETTSTSSGMYQTIFVSYSRRDVEVVETYRMAQLALGNVVFMDTYSIRSGQNWQAALAHAIQSADVLQLFWSEHSAASVNVKAEWDYALKYKCPDSRCEEFIRPVYWNMPLAAPPPGELAHLNFKYVPLAQSSSS